MYFGRETALAAITSVRKTGFAGFEQGPGEGLGKSMESSITPADRRLLKLCALHAHQHACGRAMHHRCSARTGLLTVWLGVKLPGALAAPL